jgi:hypothetical protein
MIGMKKQQSAIIALAAWLTIISVFMFLMKWMDLKLLIVLGFIGILIIAVFMEPYYFPPDYIRYFHYLIVLGSFIFMVFFIQKVFNILSPLLFATPLYF